MSCSIDNRPKNVPFSVLRKGIAGWSSLIKEGKSLDDATALSFIESIKDNGMEFIEWVDFLNERLLISDAQAKLTKQVDLLTYSNLESAGKSLGVEVNKSDNIQDNKKKLKDKNKEVNNNPERFNEAKDSIDEALSVASKGISQEKDLDASRARALGQVGGKVLHHASADIALLVDLIIPLKDASGKNFKKGNALKKKILDVIEGIWNDAHRVSIKKGNEVALRISQVAKDTGISMSKIVRTKTDVPVSGIEGRFYTQDQAVQAYVFTKGGQTVTGIPPKDLQAIIDYVENSPELTKYADGVYDATDGDIQATDNWQQLTLQGAINRHYGQEYKKQLLEEYGWNQARAELFGEDTFNKIRATYRNGDKVVKSIKSVLDGMQTGLTYDSEGGKDIAKVLAAFNALPIGGNIYIGIKQLSSFLNFVEVQGANTLGAFGAAMASSEYRDIFKRIRTSAYAKDRLGSAAYDIDFGLLLEEGKVSNSGIKNFMLDLRRQAIDVAYKPVSFGDMGAILIGGSAYVLNYQNSFIDQHKDGTSKFTDSELSAAKVSWEKANDGKPTKDDIIKEAGFQKAFLKMQGNAETTQQSKLATKISAEQRSLTGKLLLPFKTFQQQAIRHARSEYRRIKRLGDDATFEDKKKALANILYYRAVSPAIFSLLTNAVFAGMMDDDDEQKKKWAEDTLRSIIEFNLVGYGVQGAIAAIGLKLLEEIYDQLEAEKPNSGKIIKTTLGLVPAASIFARQIDRIGWEARGQNPDKLEIAILSTEIATQIPLYNLYNYVNNLRLIARQDVDAMESASLILGVKPYTLGIKEK